VYIDGRENDIIDYLAKFSNAICRLLSFECSYSGGADGGKGEARKGSTNLPMRFLHTTETATLIYYNHTSITVILQHTTNDTNIIFLFVFKYELHSTKNVSNKSVACVKVLSFVICQLFT
jgi:hypothetical protein